MKSNLIVFFSIILLSYPLFSQKMETLSLDDMSAFREQKGNWGIYGSVSMDRNVDVHHSGNSSVKVQPGKGIVINLNDETKNSPLLTAWEHGDIDLEFEFMMPKGSNSGVYLQGRYEVQLYDSWLVKNPKFSDLGGIFRNWESEKGKIYMGKAPLTNPAKAPGLWQTMHISFKAPRVDQYGIKRSNAKLNIVKVNGVTIHENLEIPLPTGGPIENNEKAKGPLMIQGDHGAVAFRNIKYRMHEVKDIKVSNLNYKYWKGPYEYEDDYKNKIPTKTGPCKDGLTWEYAEVSDYFALQLTGEIEVPNSENYYMNFIYNGNLAIAIDDKIIFKNTRAWDWDRPQASPLFLEAGKHKIDFYYSRADAWVPPSLGVFMQSDKLSKTALHNFSSHRVREAKAPIIVDVKDKPIILRAFLDFKNDAKLRRTHTIGVGDPTGTNYVFDNAIGSIACIWRGDFVDATPMWNDRGDGSFKPIGDVIFLDNTPQLDVFLSDNDAFKTSYTTEQFKPKGYKINEETGTPIYIYNVMGMDVTDQSYPDAISGSLIREVIVKDKVANVKFRIAHGQSIEKLEDGSYIIDSKYYVTTDDNATYIREINGEKELISNLPNDKIRYSLIW